MHTGVCTYFSYFIDFCARAHFLMSSICLRADVTLVLCRRSFRNQDGKKKKKPDFSLLRYPLTAARQTIIIIWHSIFLSLNRQQLGGGGGGEGLDKMKNITPHGLRAAIVPEFQPSGRLHKTTRFRIAIITYKRNILLNRRRE